MTAILAVETATDACSVALEANGGVAERHEVAPRQHSQRLFQLLDELWPGTDGSAGELLAVAYGCGPGSFTGLRIAASAAQGICFSRGVPAIPVPTLAVLAQSALSEGRVDAADTVLCVLDARIDEVYAGVFGFADGLAVPREGPLACAPEELAVTVPGPLAVLGNGCRYRVRFPAELDRRVTIWCEQVLPRARDMLPLARRQLLCGNVQSAAEVTPIYVRDEINWKKLSEQGKGS